MNKIKYLIVIGIFTCTFISCSDFLTQTPNDAIPENTFYNSSGRAVKAINAAYSTLETLYGDELSKIYTGSSDDAKISNTTGIKFSTYTYTASNSILMGVYSDLYQGVYRANQVLAKVPGIDMNKNLQNRIIGEAKFLRAFYYFQLTHLWGEVPLYTEPFKKPSDALVEKSPIKDIYAVIEQDLQDASQVLPVSYKGADVGRATKGAAEALLGKVYLYAKDYSKAYTWLGKVIDLGNQGVYALDKNFNNIINRTHENDKESIFEVQFKWIGSADVASLRDWYNRPQGPPGGFGNDLPTQSIVDAFGHYSGTSSINGRDPRLFYTIFRNGDPYMVNSKDPALKIYKSSWSATGYNIKKGMLPITLVHHGTGTNFPILRYAGALLLYAEAANGMADSPHMRDIARKAINKVRQRPDVLMPPLTVAATNTQEKMFEAIVHERRVELTFEYQRYNDLRRWGLAMKYLGPLGYTQKDRYFPLPQEEVDTNTKLKQRPGW